MKHTAHVHAGALSMLTDAPDGCAATRRALGDRVVVLKGRPARIHEEIAVDLPRPRGRDTLVLPRFAALRERVWSTLSTEAKKAEFQLGT
jgi:hypothetical protein